MNACEYLSSGAVLDLAVLGVVSERARTAAEVIGVVKRLGGARFQPTADVIAARMAGLVEAGMLTPLPDDMDECAGSLRRAGAPMCGGC